jgi:pilus assembly protein CpaC
VIFARFRGVIEILLVVVVLAGTASAQPERAQYINPQDRIGPRPLVSIESARGAEILHVVVGRSIVLRSPQPFRRVYISDPAILRSFTSSPFEVVITAKAPGLTSLVVWDATGRHTLYTVSADLDSRELQASLDTAFPGANLQAEGKGERLNISGSVPTDAESQAVLKLASLYGKDIINSLQIVPVHGKQVELKLRIVEVDRTKLEQFGVNFFSGGSVPASVSTQQFSSGVTTAADGSVSVGNPLNLFLFSSSQNIGATIQDLEQKQVLQVLAEPTLTTLSGQSARFLSGGEFPFPVVQGGTGSATAITIMFRPYGVKVDFCPIVNPDGSIRLKVEPEVSTLDYSNSVTISGFTVPALSTRRAETEVELKNGQSFVVSGLLDHRTTEILSRVPGIASIPILGQLFRSKSINRSVVELVVVVTATVVDPLTSTEQPVLPKFAVPNMERSGFDAQLKRRLKTAVPTSPTP